MSDGALDRQPPDSPLAPQRRQGLVACQAALRDTLLALAPVPQEVADGHVGPPPKQLLAIDHSFAVWPLDEPAVLQALATWLREPGRRLVLIGIDFDTTAVRLPRFARWRRDLAHRIDSWYPVEGVMPDGLRGLLAGDTAWQWLDTRDAQLRAIVDPAHRKVFTADVADFLQHCEPSWPVTTLGL